MKKIMILSLTVTLFSVVSCTKNRSCSCEWGSYYNGNKVSGGESTVLYKGTTSKKEVKKACNQTQTVAGSYNNNVPGYTSTTTCVVK